MAKKKDLKQNINYICSELMAEAMATALYNGNAKQEDVNVLIANIIIMRDDFASRISHPEPGMAPKAYFDRLVEDFNNSANELLDQIRNIG